MSDASEGVWSKVASYGGRFAVLLFLVGGVAAAGNALKLIELPSVSNAGARYSGLRVGSTFTLPGGTQPSCRTWKSVEDIYAEQARVSHAAAERLVSRLAAAGECYVPKAGEQVLVTNTGFGSFQFRRSDGQEYWTAKAY